MCDRESPFVTVRQAAAILGVPPATVRSWIRKGALEAERFGPGPKPVVRIRRATLGA